MKKWSENSKKWCTTGRWEGRRQEPERDKQRRRPTQTPSCHRWHSPSESWGGHKKHVGDVDCILLFGYEQNYLRDTAKTFFLLRIRIRNGCRVADPDPYGSALMSETRSGSALEGRVGSECRLNSKFRTFRDSQLSRGGPWTLTMETLRLKIENWRVRILFRIEVKTWIWIHIKVKSWIQIRIRIKVMRIRNPEWMQAF